MRAMCIRVALAVALFSLISVERTYRPLFAYATSGKTWASPFTYYVNPSNISGLSLTQIRASVEPSAKAWCAGGQTEASCGSTYGGTTTGNTFTNNGKNEVFFLANPSVSPDALARGITWSSGSTIIDGDIGFHENRYKYYSQTGCSGGLYLENIGTHEFGHIYGLGHSSVSTATMWPSTTSYCSLAWASLDTDDIDGIEFLYPPDVAPPPPNTAPTVTISLPANNSTHTDGDSVNFAGTATDTQDGTLSSSLRWTSSLVGEIGTGASFSRVMSVGVHTITARVVDSGGLAGQTSITITVNVVSTNPTLSVSAYKVKGLQKADLTWTNLSGPTNVDVYRDGSKIITTTNDGAHTDAINAKGGGRTYVYKVCAAGSTTTCTNNASAVF